MTGVLTAITLALASHPASSAEITAARFVDEYNKAVGSLAEASKEGVCRATLNVVPIGRFPGRRFTKEIRFKDNSALSIERSETSKATTDAVYCRTDGYYFQLAKRADEPQYMIKNLLKDMTQVSKGVLTLHINLIREGAYAIHGTRLIDIVNHPTFVIERISESDASTPNPRLTVEFRVADPSHPIQAGTFSVAPKLGWSLMGYDVEVFSETDEVTKGLPRKTRIRGDVVCKRWPNGLVFPESGNYRFVHVNEPNGPEPLKAFKIEQFDNSPRSDKDFKLAQFGLPDSALLPPTPPRSPWTALFTTIGLLCVGITIALHLTIGKRDRIAKGDQTNGLSPQTA